MGHPAPSSTCFQLSQKTRARRGRYPANPCGQPKGDSASACSLSDSRTNAGGSHGGSGRASAQGAWHWAHPGRVAAGRRRGSRTLAAPAASLRLGTSGHGSKTPAEPGRLPAASCGVQCHTAFWCPGALPGSRPRACGGAGQGQHHGGEGPRDPHPSALAAIKAAQAGSFNNRNLFIVGPGGWSRRSRGGRLGCS